MKTALSLSIRKAAGTNNDLLGPIPSDKVVNNDTTLRKNKLKLKSQITPADT